MEKATKSIYYVYVQKCFVPAEATDSEIDRIIQKLVPEPENTSSWQWGESPDFLWEDV